MQSIKRFIQAEKRGIVEVSLIIVLLLLYPYIKGVGAVGIDDGMVLYYHMDEGYGATLTDETAYGNDGTVSGASWATGRFGKALSFDGINDYVLVPHDTSLNPSQFTVSLWMKPLDVTVEIQELIVKQQAYVIRQYGEALLTYVWNGSDWNPSVGETSIFEVGVYMHVTLTYDGTTQKIYVNGVESNAVAYTYSPAGAVDMEIARGWSINNFNGVLDEIRVYNRALSASEVSDLYAFHPYEYPEVPETEVLAYYFAEDLQTVNGVTGYTITETAPDSLANLTYISAGSSDASFGFRVYLQTETETTELTDGSQTAIVMRTSAGSGYQTATFTVAQTPLRFGYAMLKVAVYSRWNSSAWTNRATYITSLLYYTKVLAATWTFQVYTNLTESGGVTYWEIQFGDNTHQTGISNVLFKQPNDPDWENYYLQQGKPLDFLNFGLTARTGNVIYALIVGAFCVTLHVRYKNTGLLLMVMILFGGVGGIFNLLVGDAVLGVVWLIATFSLAALFYKVFR